MKGLRNNKKIIKSIIVILVLILSFSFIFHHPAFAAKCGEADTNLIDCGESDPDASTLRSFLIMFVNALIIGIGILGVIGITVAGIQYLTARENEQQVVKARKRLLNIVIGIATFVVFFGLLRWLLQGPLLEDIEIESISFTRQNVNLYVGGSTTLQVSVSPLDAKAEGISYSSNDEKIVKVDSKSGEVSAESPGRATITAKTPNGQEAYTVVTVNKPIEASDTNGGCYDPSSEDSKNNGSLDITLIGDSIAGQAEKQIKEKFPKSFFTMVDYRGSASNSESKCGDNKGGGLAVLKEINSGSGSVAHQHASGACDKVTINKSSLKKNIVWELGTYQDTKKDTIEKVVEIIGKNHNLFLVTPWLPNEKKEDTAKLYRDIANDHSNVYLIDWNATVKTDVSKYTTSDGHPSNPAGRQLLANNIYDSVKEINTCKNKP